MSNVYTMIPKKPAQYNLLTKQERLVYVPLATRETAGIVKIGEGLGVSSGLIYIKPEVLDQITDNRVSLDLKVDKDFDSGMSGGSFAGHIYNDYRGVVLSSVRGGLSAISQYSTVRTLNLTDGSFSSDYNYEDREDDATNVSHKVSLSFSGAGSDIKLIYNKNTNGTNDKYNGEISTVPYVDYNTDLLREYVDDKITNVKKSAAYVFDTFEQFEQWINGVYVRPDDNATVNDLHIGDEVFIKEEGIPDYWVASILKPFTLDNFIAYESGEALLFGNYYTKDEIDVLFEERVADVKIDELSITKNDSGQIQTTGVIDQNTGNTNKEWTGTQAEYDALIEKDLDTIYYITDVDKISSINDLSLYITGSVISSAKTFTKHVHVMLEFETDGVHGGTDFVLHPYDTSICFVTYDVLINGQLYSAQAYLDDSGYVRINIPNGLTFTNVNGHYIEFGG